VSDHKERLLERAASQGDMEASRQLLAGRLRRDPNTCPKCQQRNAEPVLTKESDCCCWPCYKENIDGGMADYRCADCPSRKAQGLPETMPPA